MCGICGICHRDPDARPDPELLKRMTATLRHRGPDGEGFLVRNNVAFGHRRLSIIDLAGGDQPIYNEDGTVGIVFNGEIYNYVELMADLTARGHRFTTRSDTEVIVHLYEECGESCVDHLRGMFAFAIWDGRTSRVLLARDRLGIKPLFFRIDGDQLAFASELKSLLDDRAIPRNLDLGALSAYIAYGYVPGHCCILKGISKLSPGHTLVWQDGRATVREYWDVAFGTNDGRPRTEYAGALNERLTEAVRLHLRSDVPVGALLSGGLDSSTVVALASTQLTAPLKTFSVGFSERDYDELQWARMIAKRFATQHHEILVKDRDVDDLPEIVRYLDEPFADPSALPSYYICREAARHVRVCLSGDGADEVFAGYTRYRDAASYRYVDWIPTGLRRTMCEWIGAAIPSAMWGKGLVERVGADGAHRYLESVGVFSVAETTLLLIDSGSRYDLLRPLQPYLDDSRIDVVTRMQHADQKCYLPDDILVKVDRLSMQNSLELRPPFLDHRVVEFGNSCPTDLKMRNGAGKAILREIMADRLPREVLQRRKMGFGIPIKHWFRGGLERLARDVLLGPSSCSAAVLSRKAVGALIGGHARGMRDLSRRIWSLIVLEYWMRTYLRR